MASFRIHFHGGEEQIAEEMAHVAEKAFDIMSEELHETLCVLFIEIQKPWAIHCPANRTNFFNYTYTLYQLCVLLDQTQYLPYIPLMKDREKQLEQDQIWKKVCEELDWVYYPTV